MPSFPLGSRRADLGSSQLESRAETLVIPGYAQAAAVLHSFPRWFFLLYDLNKLNCLLMLPP